MTVLSPPVDRTGPAELTAREALLNATLRETGARPAAAGPWRLPVPGGRVLVARIRRWSPSGHHRWDPRIEIEQDGTGRPVAHAEFVRLLLEAVESELPAGVAGSEPGRVDALSTQIASSVRRIARFLAAPARAEPSDAHGRTRHAEQSVRRGHPFHPTAKSFEGPAGRGGDGAERYAPELGASFLLHHLALAPELAAGETLGVGPWLPAEVEDAAPKGWPVLPVHPWQLDHVRAHPVLAPLLARGALRELGEGPRPVYATSSVRTVCDPTFPTAWKLPMHARITNFVRNVPPEHARRATDASRLVGELRTAWDHPGFSVLLESGWRGVDPGTVGDSPAADLIVVFRENPFVTDPAAPRVLAALLEEGPGDEEPPLVREIRSAGVDVVDWLREYLAISLSPLLAVFDQHGVGFEAHLQNALLHTECGWPARFWVRDMEGTHVAAGRRPAGLPATSPLVHDDHEAWRRLRYHAVVNQLATLIAKLGPPLASGGEPALWRVVAEELERSVEAAEPGARWAGDLLTSPSLPAKANLVSRFVGRGESPLFVDLPNPIRGAVP